ncbi:MAG: nucleotidyltransferase domain-containing protein [Archaeoglobaceae archaeon]
MESTEKIDRILEKDKDRIKFIVLYGSFAEGTQRAESDVDLCVYYDGSERERFEFRKKVLGDLPSNYDVQTFQDLPIYVKKNVIKGELLYGDYDFFFWTVRETIREWEDSKHRYELLFGAKK